MKKVITLLLVIATSFANAQAYKGKGDVKAQVGANIQSGGTGIFVSGDFGVGENMSIGFSSSYLLSANKTYLSYDTTKFAIEEVKPEFIDRIDAKARFNIHLGNVIGLDKKMDIYPGLDLGIRNFGTHAGFRYFFTDGFGVFAEAGIPIAKYDTKSTGFKNYNNQFTFNAGVSFNL